MLYGYKETLDNRVATLVVAAETVEEYNTWIQAVANQTEGNWEETYASNFLDAMRNEAFKGYKQPVLAIYHTDTEQRDAFWTEWDVTEVLSAIGRDRHLDMIHAKKEEIREATETEADKLRTIEERLGLDVHDPWDRRSEEEVEADKKMKEQMKEMEKAGKLSGDGSFSGADKQRADRPNANNVPGAYSRTQAIEALKTFGDLDAAEGAEPTDWESQTNEELTESLKKAGVPDVNGVYNDGEVPQKAKEGSGGIFVSDIEGTRNEDGSLDISSVRAHKPGAEVDEVEKAAREAAHEAQVEEAKGGKRAFSPEDFAAVLRGDGSADAVAHVEGDDRRTRKAASRPSLSDHAEQARQEHQAEQAKAAKTRREQARREADVKARGERDRGIFKGADLVEDEDLTPWDDLPENIRDMLEKANLKRDELSVKNYPYNSELGGRVLLPTDTLNPDGMRLVGHDNLTIEGSMTMNGPGVMVASREDTSKDGYGIYAKRRKVTIKAEGDLDLGDTVETKIDIWLVRVRS